MFSGIIETLGEVREIKKEGSNIHFTIFSTISDELTIDQSIAHNGVCLTVVATAEGTHTVTAVEETLKRTNLGKLQPRGIINLERAMASNGRLDGHIVQGHVDGTGICTQIRQGDGSWYFHFRYAASEEHLLVDKGSISINGVSLTVIEPHDGEFSVAIIPYTYDNTTFKEMKTGDMVNLEFDIIGKYIAKYAGLYFRSAQKK